MDRADQRPSADLDRLQHMVQQQQLSSDPKIPSNGGQTERALSPCARDIISTKTIVDETSFAENLAGVEATNSARVAEWIKALESMRHEMSNIESSALPRGKQTPSPKLEQDTNCLDHAGDDSDDDLEVDLAKAALDTGTKAFAAEHWNEATSLLREALRILQQISTARRKFCDIFDLHYKLAVCAYQIQDYVNAEKAFTSLIRQPPNSMEQHQRICDATHLLSQLYIHTEQLDRARSECEKALQSRRRLLGKKSQASLESLALMAHIYVLLDNRALAKSCLSMIPDERRDATLAIVEKALGGKVDHLDFTTILMQPNAVDIDGSVTKPMQSNLSDSTLGHLTSSPGTSHKTAQEFTASFQEPSRRTASPWQSPRNYRTELIEDDRQSIATTYTLPMDEKKGRPSRLDEIEADARSIAGSRTSDRTPTSPTDLPEAVAPPKNDLLSRKEILHKVGCQPRDRIEEAVCDGNKSLLLSLLKKKKGFWLSALRKRGRVERVTALHFAALFGEIDMTRILLSFDFNINEVPFGYSTRLSPLHFAIGARQVDMVDFLIANGARPSEPDTWSTLAGQLMSRSWLAKTMSQVEKEFAPVRIVAIMRILIRHGWDVNVPIDTNGRTVLHQAVSFWTGEYKWDLDLRAEVTSFLCDTNANPHQVDKEGKTPHSVAVASGHQDLVFVLEHGSRKRDIHDLGVGLVELPDQIH